MKNQTTSQSEDWVKANGNKEPFARFPIQILSLGLTKVQLEVFLILSSKALRDGRIHPGFEPSYANIAELRGKFSNRAKGTPDTEAVKDAVKILKAHGLLIVSKKSGVNRTNKYQLTLPAGLKSRPTTDRGTPEYLAGAEATRQAVRENYAQKAANKAAQHAPCFDVVEDADELPPVLEMWPEAADSAPLAGSHAFSSEELPDEFVDSRNWVGVSDDDEFDEEF